MKQIILTVATIFYIFQQYFYEEQRFRLLNSILVFIWLGREDKENIKGEARVL